MMSRVAVTVLIVALLVPGAVRADYVFNAFPDLSNFNLPMGIEDPLDGTDRLFVLERDGLIYVFANDATTGTRALFLNISTELTTTGEGGLLGLAFHPDYEDNGYFYVTYTAENPRREVLARYTESAANPNAANPSSKLVILEIPKSNLYHNGGRIAFGPDGYLYWSLGEDGFAHLAQDVTTFNGKLLRIDVDNPSGGNQYGIPPDNPFVGEAGLDEIYAYGFRNPWRFTFDPPTGRIWLGDVGQNTWEEINIVRKGRNYGWPRMEGSDCFPSPSSCDTTGLNVVPPLFVYEHQGSASITGGFVYRGSTIPSLVGKYIYADYITGQMWALSWNGVNPPTNDFLTTLFNVPSFGVDKDGELFIASFDGNIYRLFATTTGVETPALSARNLTGAPNPFRESIAVSFSLDAPARATLEVFDVSGRRVSVLMDREVTSGRTEVEWNSRQAAEEPLASGVYFVRLSLNGSAAESRRITLVR